MADGDVALQPLKVFLLEGLADEAHRGVHAYALAVAGGDPGALLSAVLQSV